MEQMTWETTVKCILVLLPLVTVTRRISGSHNCSPEACGFGKIGRKGRLGVSELGGRMLPAFYPVLCEVMWSGSFGGALAAAMLICISLEDAETKTIPNLYAFTLWAVAAANFAWEANSMDSSQRLGRLVGFAVGFTVFTLISVLSKGAMGFGDVKLAVPFIIIYGPGYFTAVFAISLVCIMLFSLPVVAIRASKRLPVKNYAIPYAPFFTLALLLMKVA